MISTGICRWLILLISLSTWTKLTDSKEMRVVCYYTNWSVYRPGPAKFSPQNINPYLCTHLVYAFGGFTKENNLKPFDKYQDIEKGGYAKFTGLKTYNKNLKTLIAIGGWNEGSSRFSPMVASADRRKELVKNTVKFLRQNHFDGLDLDWEYPTFRDGGKTRDRDNYAQLVKELREEFERESEKTGRPRLLLTMAVPAGIEYINKGYDVPKLMKYLDWMNILSYDYHSAFEPSVNHHAPLYSLEEENEYNYDTELNIDYTIKHYLKQGADPAKLILGIPTYGRSYTLFNPDAYEIGSPADGPGDMGEYTRENGYLAYYEICDYIKDQDWEVVQPNPDAMGPYAFKDNQWVGYDDENIVRKKAEYVVENGLGGIMFWAIDNDDFRGSCHGKPYPLIEAAKEAMLNAYGITDENLISPPSKPTKTKSKSRTRPSSKTSTSIDEEKNVVSKTTSSSTGRRRRIKTKSRTEEPTTERPSRRRINKDSKKQETSSYSSLSVITPAYTTPEPPSTPDQGGAFKCEDEGFFPHPKDCKKYFWCLSGAGDSGIIAHQFTCPAGLYFNKAADSCDYTQNVFCNKKLQKSTTTTTTSESSTSDATTKATTTKKSLLRTSLFATTRAPPKITAATSRTSFRPTTTTAKYEEEDEEEEYEYEDDEVGNDKKSEEDPRVIKELIDLIRKAGGIEELEKQLRLGGKSSTPSGPDSTTQSAISKSLYERVLAKTGKNALNALKKSSVATRNRNSGGSQSNGLEKEDKPSSRDRSRPQYQTITRHRPTTEKSAQDEDAKEAEESQPKENSQRAPLFKTKSTPEYVNIRRGRLSTTPEPDDDRNKILEEEDEEDLEDEDVEDEKDGGNKRRSTTPKYVSIRRQRPPTTEGPSTSKYVELRRRPTTTSTITPEAELEDSSKRYQTIRRATTSASPDDSSVTTTRSVTTTVAQENENTSPKYISIRRGTTTSSTSTAGYYENEVTERSQPKEENVAVTLISVISTSSAASETTTNASSSLAVTEVNIANIPGASSIESQTVTSVKPDEASSSQIKNLVETTESSLESEITTEAKTLLSQPGPFSTRSSTTITNTEQASKVSQSNLKFRIRPKVSESPQTTEPTTVRSRGRGPSRFNIRNKNTNNEEKLTENGSQLAPTVRKRRPATTATEKHVDFNEELERNYRPSELADLSSLTAVDVNVRGLDLAAGKQRRRRPLTTTANTTSPAVTTEKSEQPTKNSLRPSPLIRKLSERNKKTNDLVNSSSESKFPTRIRGFRTSTENSTQNAETTTSNTLLRSTREGTNEASSVRPRKIIRRFRPTSTARTTTTASDEKIESTTSQTLLRRRTLFRTKQNSSEATKAEDENTLQKVLNKKPVRLPFVNQDEKEDPAANSEEISEEGENIKLSESNIRENSDVNSFDLSGKKRRKFVKLIPKSKADALYSKSYNENKPSISKEDIETTTTTTPSPTTTTSATSTTEELDILQKIGDVNETTTEKVTEIPSTKEPNVVRRRKIIRKFKPTESALTTEKAIENKDQNEPKRKRKVIRRLRPVSSTNTLDIKENKETELPKPKFRIRNKSTTSTTTTTTESSTNVDRPVAQRLYRLNLSQRRNRFGKPEVEQKSDDEKESNLKLKEENPPTTIADSSTQASTIAYSLYGEKITTEDKQDPSASTPSGRLRLYTRQKEEKELSASTPSSRLRIYTRPSPTTANKEPEPELTSSTPSYYTSSTTESDEDDDMLHSFSTIDDRESDLEPFMSTPTYSYYSRPTTERDHYDEEEDDEEYDPEDDEEDDIMDDSDEEPHGEEPKYVSFSRTTTTKKSHHFVSSINFNDENEQDKDASVKENMSVNSTIVKSLKNVHNISTLTVPSPEGGTENPSITNDETSTGNEGLVSQKSDVNDTLYTTERFTPEAETNQNEKTTEKLEKVSPSSTEKSSLDVTSAIVSEVVTLIDNNTGSNTILSTSTMSVPIETTEFSNEIIESTATTSENQGAQSSSLSNTETATVGESTTLKETTTQTTTVDSKISSSTLITTTVEPPREILNITEASTEYQRRSTLRSVQGRPKYNVPKRTSASTTTRSYITEQSVEEPTRKTKVGTSKFTRSRFQKSSTPRVPVRSKLATKASTPLPINRNIYRYSTTERTRYVIPDDEEEEQGEDFEDEPDVETEDEDNVEETHDITTKKSTYVKPLFTQKATTESSRRKVNSPDKTQTVKSPNKTINKPKVLTTTTTTESPKEDLGIDTEAIKNRNKNLFAKRKMNTPFAGTTAAKVESVTKSTPAQTTESMTTLHHIFAEIGDTGATNDMETTTESIITPTTAPSKIEKLIEVNRIIEIYSKEAGVVEGETKVQVIPTVDKIGAVNRVTIIKIVDGNNVTTIKEDSKGEIEKETSTSTTVTTTTSPPTSTTTFVPIINLNGDIVEVAKVEEVPAPATVNKVNLTNISLNIKMQKDNDETQREDRKYDIINVQSKPSDNSLSDSFSKPEIIDGRSHINIVTPRVQGTAASTIPLQSLFQTEPSTSNHLNPSFSSNDELLETEHSKYVDIRVLKQDDDTDLGKAPRDNSQILPIKILEQDDEEITLRARVVEVTPRPNADTIRIVPIKVEMSRKLTENLPLYQVQKIN